MASPSNNSFNGKSPIFHKPIFTSQTILDVFRTEVSESDASSVSESSGKLYNRDVAGRKIHKNFI